VKRILILVGLLAAQASVLPAQRIEEIVVTA
jgi:hypothetical protein